MRKQVIELLPLMTGYLIGISYFNLQGYYDPVSINIYNYVSAPELVLSFIPYLFELGRPFYTQIFLTIIVVQHLTYRRQLQEIRGKEVAIDDKNSLHSGFKFFGFIVLTAILIISSYFEYFVFQKTAAEITKLRYANFISSSTVILTMYFIVTNELPKDYVERKKDILFAALFVYIAFCVNNNSKLHGLETILKRNSGYISFISDDVLIETDSVNIFYGETNEYIFIYNVNDSIVRTFQRENIKNIAFRKTIPLKINVIKPNNVILDTSQLGKP